MLLVAGMSLGSSCSSCRGPIIEIPQCIDTPDELFEIPLPEEWEDWYLGEYDPLCEALRNASHIE